MSKEKVELVVDGGKAGITPTMGQQFGPLGINIQAILQKINEKTSAFKGMKVPVKITVDTDTKEFDLEVGTPPVSELIKKEISVEKGSGSQDLNKIGNLSIEQVIKIAKMKKDSMLVNYLKSAVKNVIGTCNAMGVLVESEEASKVVKKINEGVFDKEIKQEKTEPSQEKLTELKQNLQNIQTIIAAEQARLEAEKEAAKAAAGITKETEEKVTEEQPAKEGEETKEIKSAASEAKPGKEVKPTAKSQASSKPQSK